MQLAMHAIFSVLLTSTGLVPCVPDENAGPWRGGPIREVLRTGGSQELFEESDA
jgi:hypothetical protein